jgi:hypothetical protein
MTLDAKKCQQLHRAGNGGYMFSINNESKQYTCHSNDHIGDQESCLLWILNVKRQPVTIIPVKMHHLER